MFSEYFSINFVGCRKTVTAINGYLLHPGYPNPYKNDIDCTWTIQAPLRRRISLKFQFFNFEQSENCQNDYLAIYDGPSGTYPLINIFCGPDTPPIVKSSANTMFVRMKTNENINGHGFAAVYEQISDSSNFRR